MPTHAQETPASTDAGSTAPVEASGERSAGTGVPAEIPLISPDAALVDRLRGIYADVGGLEQVTVRVRSGIVHLAGSTLTPDDRRRAEAIAKRLTGVVEVDNDIKTDTRVRQRIEPLADRIRELGRDAVGYLPLLAVALVVLVGFRLLGGLAIRALRPFRSRIPNLFLEELLGQAIKIAFTVAGLIVAMNILGLSALLTTVLGAAGVFGLAIGFAVRDTIENYIASILLSVRQPFGPGDHVLIAGYEGRIAMLNSRATVLVTLDGNEVRIPNATVYKSVITNFTHLPERRFEFEIGIGKDEDTGRALKLASTALATVSGVLNEPAPLALVDRFADTLVVIKIFGWVNQNDVDLAKARSASIRKVKAAFDKEGVEIPAPLSEVRLSRSVGGSRDHDTGGTDTSDTDIRPDTTIQRKAHALRADSSTDLLNTEASRE